VHLTNVSFEFPTRCALGSLRGVLQRVETTLIDRLINAQIILCAPGRLGLALTFASGFTTSFEVGDLKEANAELRRISAGIGERAA
jgi:hypothetical protein